MLKFPNREALVGEVFPKEGIGAEIGVFLGQFAETLLDKTKPNHMYLVDVWGDPGDGTWKGNEEYLTAQFENLYQQVVTKFGSRPEITIERLSSVRAALKLQDMHEVFDWIYIDANHQYKFVCADLYLWWPLLEPGGILAGHDFTDHGEWNIKVKEAVADFMSVMDVPLYAISLEDRGSWAIRKPFR